MGLWGGGGRLPLRQKCPSLEPLQPRLPRCALAGEQVVDVRGRALELLAELVVGHLRARRDGELEEVIEARDVRDAEPVGDDLAPAVRPEVLGVDRGRGEHPVRGALHDRVREERGHLLVLLHEHLQACGGGSRSEVIGDSVPWPGRCGVEDREMETHRRDGGQRRARCPPRVRTSRES